MKEKEILSFLVNISNKNNLINLAIRNCRKINDEIPIEEYLSYDFIYKNKFTKNDIIISFLSQSLIFNPFLFKDNLLIETKLKLFTNKTLTNYTSEVGYYRLLSNLNGETYDDFL